MKFPFSPPIDKLLDGGLETGCITNFYGPSATGKTNICLAAISSAAGKGKKVIYIDTEGGFSLDRFEQICNSTSKKFLEKIIFLEPKNWQEQVEQFEKLEKICAKEDVGLIVVDSVVALWRISITEANATEINRQLATQLSLLSKLARERAIPVLITNQVYSDIETGKIELSSRNIVKWWSKNLVELMHAGRTSCRIARIAKARSLPEDKTIEFEITGDGLREVSKLRIF